jgi:hypothetical protein
MTPWGLSQYLVFINQDRGLTYVIRAELTELAIELIILQETFSFWGAAKTLPLTRRHLTKN